MLSHTTTREPHATKSGPGRRHAHGINRGNFKYKRAGKLGAGWMANRLLAWVAAGNLAKQAEQGKRSGLLTDQDGVFTEVGRDPMGRMNLKPAGLRRKWVAGISARTPEAIAARTVTTSYEELVRTTKFKPTYSPDLIAPVAALGAEMIQRVLDKRAFTEELENIDYRLSLKSAARPTHSPTVAQGMSIMDEAFADTTAAMQDFSKSLADTTTAMQDFSKSLDEAAVSDEDALFNFISEQPGVSFGDINEFMFGLTETQVERRLKKLRAAGKIHFDKAQKGWFVTPTTTNGA